MKAEIKGLIYVAINSLLVAIVSVLFKFSKLDGFQMSLCISIIGSCLGIALYSLDNKSDNLLNKKHLKALSNGLIFGGGTILTWLCSIDEIGPLNSTVILVFTSTISAMIIEKVRLRKPPHWLSVGGVLLGVTGILCMCQDENQRDSKTTWSFNLQYVKGITFAVTAGACNMFFFLFVHVQQDVSTLWHLICYMLGCAAPSIPGVYKTLQLPSCDVNVQIIGLVVAVGMFLAPYFAMKGLTVVKTSTVFIFQLLTSVFTFVLQLIFLPHLISIFSCIGALALLVAVTIQFVVITKIQKRKMGGSESITPTIIPTRDADSQRSRDVGR